MCRKRIVMFFLSGLSLFSNAQGQEKAFPETQYIIHVVKFGETLSKISREYGITVTDILNVNPSLGEINNLSPEQLIRIPNKGNKKIISNSNTGTNGLEPKVTAKQELIPRNATLHTVEKGQTLFSISKIYHVKVEDLQKWNDLPDNNVKIGSQIVVSPDVKSIPKQATNFPANTKQEPFIKMEEISQQVTDTETINSSEPETTDIQASDNAGQKELGKLFKEKIYSGNMQTVKGTGAPMTTSLGAMEHTYFAMHKTLPIGTIIKIKNLVNSKIIYAKVIGKLPETDENKHVIVRYTLGVKKDLQLQNGKCYVQIEYPE